MRFPARSRYASLCRKRIGSTRRARDAGKPRKRGGGKFRGGNCAGLRRVGGNCNAAPSRLRARRWRCGGFGNAAGGNDSDGNGRRGNDQGGDCGREKSVGGVGLAGDVQEGRTESSERDSEYCACGCGRVFCVGGAGAEPEAAGEGGAGGARVRGVGELRSEVPRREDGDVVSRGAADLPEGGGGG